MRAKVQRWGNSLAIRIPKVFAEEVGLTDDSPIELRLTKGGLLLEPAPQWGPSLDELLDAITEENLHSEVDTGAPRGSEEW